MWWRHANHQVECLKSLPWPHSISRGEERRGEERDCNKYPWIICSAQPHHSGNYTCKPSSSTPASIQLFVLGEKNILFLSCKFLANDHIRKHLLPRWAPQWYGDLVLKRAWLWLVNYYFYIDLEIKDSCLLSTCLLTTILRTKIFQTTRLGLFTLTARNLWEQEVHFSPFS